MKKYIISVLLAALFLINGCAAVPTYEPVEYSSYNELSPQGVNWGFVRKKGSVPDVMAKDAEMLEAYNGYYIDRAKPKAVYLTFDEGYENGYTSKILDILQEKEVKAAFFVTGPYLETQTELVRRMFDEGHIVGNHTINHINMAESDEETVKSEINGLSAKCEELYNKPMKYIRPPEGTFSERSLAISRDLGYKTILWSFAYKDWDVNVQQGGEYAFNQITPYLHDGEIMLLHAVSSDNAAALGDVIDFVRSEGYEFRSLDELE